MTSSSRRLVRQRSRFNPAWVAALLCPFVPAVALAQGVRGQMDAQAPAQLQPDAQAKTSAATPQPEAPAPTESDGLPGSPSSVAVGVSPEAPPTPSAPGGRAPAFGTASDPDAWVFKLGGRISGFGQLGIGRNPTAGFEGEQEGIRFHTPPRIVGRTPIYAGPGGTLNFQYGSQTIMAFVSVEASLNTKEWQGYHQGEKGPRIRTAYVAVAPEPIGNLRLRFQVGAFPANYGAPGPWGWGIFGPVLAVHGYGGTANASYDLSPKTKLYFEYGVAAVPEVDEATVRGTYTDWPEAGLSTVVHHVHGGVSYENKYSAKLHLAYADGRDMSRYLRNDDPATPSTIERSIDGHLDVAALELRWQADPYGELGVTPVYWNFKDALSVHDGIWWGIDWTAGGREMTNKFLGHESAGNGKLVAVSAEYDFSVKRMLLHPKPFDGNGPDLRVSLAFLPFWTVKSADPSYDKTSGYFLGASFEHVLLPWLSTSYQLFGESRSGATVDIFGEPQTGNWRSYSATVGLILHSGWQSQDRVVLAYSRYFYSKFTDNNPALPLDRDVFTLGGSVAF